ncbi:hypothetical protein SLS62_011355 [Diatrype stigma]|uniref:AAA+ ATPase domain-containing protein n=1 Tax=Diatrype stigma TaxID=117547 RepID=A0AAN9U6S6_9PEZI
MASESADSQQVLNEQVAKQDQGSEGSKGSNKEELKADEPKESGESKEPKEMKSELAYLDKKYDSDGNRYYKLRQNTSDEESSKWWRLFALAETRHFHADGRYKATRLHINPQTLKQLLQDVIVDYPYEPIDAQEVVQLDVPAYCLFFYRKELETTGMERFKDDETSLGYLKLLLDWIDRAFEDAFKAHRRFQSSEPKPISYENLWTIFKPGTLVYNRMLGQHRAFKLTRFAYEDDREPCLALRAQYVDFDGTKFGTLKTWIRIPRYSGTMRCAELNAMPLDCHPSAERIRAELLARGRRFQELTGQHFRHYRGTAIMKNGEDQQGARHGKFHVDGRVVIDCKTYLQWETNHEIDLEDLDRTEAAKRQRTMLQWNEEAEAGEAGAGAEKEKLLFDELLEEDLLVATSTVRGFDFADRAFREFFLENLAPIRWDDACFDQLVLDPVPKRTVQALVSVHVRRGQDGPGSFDDIVAGKGKGLVMVLHGPPGVGKTLTAECVAEWAHRPLYMVAAGDLGTDSANLEYTLKRIMTITSTWGAVLLIDEADVFLERRSLNDMQRNAMVSVFLRVLEYYRGILFLTTNRVSAFDEAFTSRIHVPLRYSGLQEPSRRIIWRNFCGRVPGGMEISEEQLDQLAKHELNGRQIKNIVKSAESLAAFEGRNLDAAQLEAFTKIHGDFERDWMGFVDVQE